MRPIPSSYAPVAHCDPTETVVVTIEVRRFVGHHPVPDHSDYVGCPRRKRLSNDDFAARFGASADDLNAVSQYYATFGLATLSQHVARRMVELSGTIAQHNAAFGVTLRTYEKTDGRGRVIQFRHHDTEVRIPPVLRDIVLAVHCLHSFPAAPATAPANTNAILGSTLMSLYQWPTNMATGQNIAIVDGGLGSDAGYASADITNGCAVQGVPVPTITNVFLNGATNVTPATQSETTFDILAAAVYGQGAGVAVYFNGGQGIELTVARIATPQGGDPVCNIISCSWFSPEFNGSTTSLVFQDAAIQGITIFGCSGDTGSIPQSGSSIGVVFPAVHPYVTAVGGTTVGSISGSTFTEWMWNDGPGSFFVGVTGGGVGAYFAQPAYQANANVPASLAAPASNGLNGAAGRGVPDIAGNANASSGIVGRYLGSSFQFGGTSLTTPMYAGLAARINASLGRNIGFINPTLYAIANTGGIIRDIAPLSGESTNNGNYNNNGVAGYNLTTGWDACTGWGVINGQAFLNYLAAQPATKSYWVQVQAVNSFGTGPVSATAGPTTVVR
jgi:kumamolisin